MASIRFLGASGTVTFPVHGEPPALAAARERLRRLGWPCEVPRHPEPFGPGG